MGEHTTSGATRRTFSEFYPYYLSQHADRTCRRLHFAGTWVGRFFFEKWKDTLTGRIKL